jgi:hypothetical protein
LAVKGEPGVLGKAGVIAALLLASVWHAEAQSHSEQALAADGQSTQQKQNAGPDGFQACLGPATAAHDASWATECKRVNARDRADYANCLDTLKLPKTYCDSSYVIHDPAPTCTLPPSIATVLDADLERARLRCRKDSNAALQ